MENLYLQNRLEYRQNVGSFVYQLGECLMNTKLLCALRTFVNQRPGLDFGNYGDASAYRAEMRTITKSRADALSMINYIAWHDSISIDDIIEASRRAFSGRLTINSDFTIDYCTGQYWPTEYRHTVACVLANVLWHYFSTNLGDSANGNAIRKAAHCELGRSIASKYFN